MSVTPVTKDATRQAIRPSPSLHNRRRADMLPYLLLLPSLLFILLIELYPFLTGFLYSFQNGSLLASGTFVGLQTIDTSLYEAARMDGAGRWDTFRSVTFPGIQNISVILWILMAIWSINDFATPFFLTQGGPSNATESLMILAYKDTFARNSVGSGSAVAFISLLILMVLGIVMMRVRNRD